MKFGVLLAALALLISAPCFAQYGGEDMNMWTVRAGVLFPSGDTVDNSEFTAGIEYAKSTGTMDGDKSNWITLSADWTEITTATITGTDNVTLIPLLVNWKQKRMMDATRGWTYGVGAGVFMASDPIPEMDLSDDTEFAWQVMTAYDFSESLALEARYIAGSNP
ncbi:MAG: hypothetical protein ACYC08_07780, partial [Armatimonadota bacterium]